MINLPNFAQIAFLAVLILAGSSFSANASMPPDDFALTRVFINQPKQISFRHLYEGVSDKEDGYIQEFTPFISLGLPGRFQLSLHGVIAVEEGSTFLDSYVPEVRYAVEKYGELFLNPVVGLSYSIEHSGANTLRTFLQTSQVFKTDWLWASNTIFEKKMDGFHDREYIYYSALRKIDIRNGLSLGGELKLEYSTSEKPGFKNFHELLIGPSAVWHLNSHYSLQLNTMLGLSKDSPHSETNFLCVLQR